MKPKLCRGKFSTILMGSTKWDGNFNIVFKYWRSGVATLIAEIGKFKSFSVVAKFFSWLLVVPNVYQSAEKFYNAGITKRGSKVAKWIWI